MPLKTLGATSSIQLLALTKTTTTQAGISTEANVTDLDGTVISRGRPLRIDYGVSSVQNTLAGGGAFIRVYEDINNDGSFTQIGQFCAGPCFANNANCPTGAGPSITRPAQPAGTIIRYQVRAQTLGAGTATITVGATFPAFLTVTEL